MSEFEATVRPFQLADREAVVELWRMVFPDESGWNEPDGVIHRKSSVQPELFFVCECSGELVGSVLAGFDGVRGWVHHLAVHPSFRRRGLATRLMGSAEQALGDLGCPKLNLQVRAINAGVVDFYQSLGYGIEDRISLGKPLGEWVDD
jgi:hypothetical protein